MTEGDRMSAHERVILATARGFYLAGLDWDDVLQEARIAALVAVRSFDPALGSLEGSWVSFCIRRRLATLVRMDHMEKRASFRDSGVDGEARRGG